MSAELVAQRMAVLVDVQNMFYSAYDCFRGRLNYKKLLDTARGERQLVRAIAYAMRDGNDQSSFFTMLREVGFELRTKEPRVRPDGSRKGGWDIGIAVEAITLAPKLDVVALVSGDGDFVDLVHALRARGVRVEVYAFERSTGRELREAADEFIPIGEDLIFRESQPTEERQPETPRRPARTSSFGAGILDDEDQDSPPPGAYDSESGL
ncbi:MAG: NYN domain-containing protein [Candidatus Brocadiia bacterium]